MDVLPLKAAGASAGSAPRRLNFTGSSACLRRARAEIHAARIGTPSRFGARERRAVTPT